APAERPWLSSYPPGVPAEIDLTGADTLVAIWAESRAKWGGRRALDCFGVPMLYEELGRHADAIAAWLQGEGLQKGDRVAIMMPNLMAYPVVLLGVLIAGGVVVNVNPLYTAREIEHQLGDAGARFLFVMENFAHTAAAAAPVLPVERYVVVSAGDLLKWKGPLVDFVARRVKKMVPPFDLPNSLTLAAALRAGRRRKLAPVAVGPDDIAFLQYTGGTTGIAKGATLLHRNVAANIMQARLWFGGFLTNDGPQVMVTALPLYHIFALTVCCFYFLATGGACLLVPNPRDIPGLIKLMRRQPFTMLSGVNTLYAALADNPELAKVDFSKVFGCVAGGMATQEAVARRWRKLTGKPIVEGYGLSETSPIVCTNRFDIEAFTGTVGYPLSSTDISIRDAQGEVVGKGEAGELCVRGPQVMAGYWGRPYETAVVMTEDGFFRTGDVAMELPDGSIKLVDRLKEMILVSGFNVYPNEVEDVLMQNDKVASVAVVGAPDPHSGEAVVAFIVRRDPDLTAEELISFCRENLTGYKIPRRIEFREDLPKSNVGKVLRRVLKDEILRG
ncbi:AMP-binding protein, partial [Rhodoblastus sp.]|uniref:AMP-binding protein n=1 Tax=Rhodoblastus sp. TaxID=1962975 RepID=UPI0035B131FE